MTKPLVATDRQSILDGLADSWKPGEIRDLAATLLRLADSLDQRWDDTSTRPIFRWPNALSRIERNALNLAMTARVIYQQRRKRHDFLPAQFLGEPAWDILLELFMQFAGGAKVSTTSLCIAADVPASTALRYIAQLEQAGLVKRESSAFDKRVTFVSLTDQGVLAVGLYLEQH
ncbi:winged helix DNA-binding protein [Altererythrobacter sp. KTW20L]|uniref:winged helix DNA-binding protein n=1 Tax=Altererythrobacter sp. KTW20L TaxID=2942210 RepID=UPI0020BF3C0F|nr:winged helix DNA-binding protein [Altererythrobacter sp. KTW20L]MCL6250699.1 winged helix DNA-binding protein [Altererythrobacter sp. KTW20L]